MRNPLRPRTDRFSSQVEDALLAESAESKAMLRQRFVDLEARVAELECTNAARHSYLVRCIVCGATRDDHTDEHEFR